LLGWLLLAAGCWLVAGWLLAARVAKRKQGQVGSGCYWKQEAKSGCWLGTRRTHYSLLRVVSQLSAVSQVLILTQAASSD
jgi:hypothetical protein